MNVDSGAIPTPSRPPWVAVTCLVVTVVVVSAVVWGLVSRPPPPECGGTECGVDFEIGNPVGPYRCDGVGAPTVGCVAGGDYVYQVTIETAFVPFGDILFRVVLANGSVDFADSHGGFNILDAAGATVAAFNLSESGSLAVPNASAWTYFTATTGISAQSPLTNIYSLIVDVGTTSTAGQGDILQATDPSAGPGSLSLGLP